MSRHLLTSALLLAASCQPAPGGEQADSPSITPNGSVVGRVPAELQPERLAVPPSKVTQVDDVQPALRAAGAPPTPRTIDEEFARVYGEPSSPEFLALDARTREAVKRFALHGPGAVGPQGTIDPGVSRTSSLQSGNGSVAAAQLVTHGEPVPGYPGLFNVTLSNTGTGYVEQFLLQLPDSPPTGPVPLIVVFHKFGVSHFDALVNTSFIAEARARGWYMVAPLGATQKNYGSLPSQINVRVALDWTRACFPSIDRGRIYGVGFSMGGGGCATYAARHLDPAGARFAAIVNHTGSVSLAHAHANETVAAQALLESVFGGTPATQAFAYRRCSTIDLDPTTGVVGVGTDMARNLGFVHTWLANADPILYLAQQTLAFHAHVAALDPSAVLTTVGASVHSWSTLDNAAVCDWFASHSLQEPTTGSILADQDGVWHNFEIAQDAPGAFTPFKWTVDTGVNELKLAATANLRRITIDSEALGLVYEDDLYLDLSTADGTGDEVLFLDVPSPPSAVLRNGSSASGIYDSQASTFLIDETSGTSSSWVLQF